jgi:hypothetical protein
MRLYHLCRKEDISGTSGTGHVAEVAEFDDGAVVVHWMRDRNAAGVASTTVFNSLADLLRVHGHEGRTDVDLVVDSNQACQLQGTVEHLRNCLLRCIDAMKGQGASVPADILNALDSKPNSRDHPAPEFTRAYQPGLCASDNGAQPVGNIE